MTSKNLFFKLIKQDFQKRIWCPILIFITYFLAMEVRLLMMADRIKEEWYSRYYSDLGDYMEKGFFGTDTDMLAVLGCMAAFLCAMSGFSYLHSKMQLDTYHSLPVNRLQLFLAKYISGILWYAAPFAVHMLICMGIAAGRGALSLAAFGNAMSLAGVTLLVFLLAYAVFTVAICLTGNIIISMLGSVVLFFYSTAVSLLVEVMYEKFFDTYMQIGTSISEKFWSISPCSMLAKLFEQNTNGVSEYDNYFRYNSGYLWIIAVAALVYTLAAFVLFQKRASEAAGRAIAFKWAEPVIKTLIVVPAALYSGMFFEAVASGSSDAWYLFGVVFGYIIFALVLEVIFRLDIKSALCHKRQLVFNAACVTLIFIIFQYDALGYDTYVPNDSELISCSVSITELMSTAPYRFDRGYYDSGNVTGYRMENVKMQGNPSVMELARKAAADGCTYTEDAYNEQPQNYRSIKFGYNLKNNKTIYREYLIDITDKETMKLLADVYNDSGYKTGTNIMLNDGWKQEYKKLYCTGSFQQIVIDVTPEFQARLLQIYQEEYLALDFATVLDTYPVGCIMPVTQEEYDAGRRWGYFQRSPGRNGDGCLIYPQFTKTIALLKENGFDVYEPVAVEDIAYIEVQYKMETKETIAGNEYISYEYVDVAKVYDDGQKKQLLDSMLPSCYSWQVESYTDFFEEDFFVYIHTKSGNAAVLTDYEFKKGRVPAFVYETEAYQEAAGITEF